MTHKTIGYYMSLLYTVDVRHDAGSERPWFARIVELPGCMTEASTSAELKAKVEDAKRGWIEEALALGDPRAGAARHQRAAARRKEESYAGAEEPKGLVVTTVHCCGDLGGQIRRSSL